MAGRTAYRQDKRAELVDIERRRIALDIPHEDLARTASISRSAYFRARKDGLAFPRQIEALRYALRTIEQRQRAAARMLEDI